jgi:tripartite-type tricarboxylate transporter receptor subunit TctC
VPGSAAILAVVVALVAAGCGSSSGGSSSSSKTASPTAAPKYPTKAISYISPFAAGGGAYLVAERQLPYLEKDLGQNLVITSVSGASGALGWTQVAQATPDGYTVGLIGLPNIVVQPLGGTAGYTTSQLDPVCLTVGQPLVLAVPLTSPYTTLQQYLAAALNLEKTAGVKLQYVSYDGGAAQVAAFLGNHVDSVIFNASDILPYVSQARILAVSTSTAYAAFPGVKTFEAQGVDLVQETYYGMAVPLNTPSYVMTTLENACMKTTADSTFKAATVKAGTETVLMDHAQAAAEIQKEITAYQNIVSWAGINGLLG